MPSFRQASPLAAMLLVSMLAGCGSDGGGGGPDEVADGGPLLPETHPLSILAG